MTTLNCPAVLIAAPSSGQGKTTVTAALARLHARQGRRVQVFKCGPDFLDPQILAVASGQAVYNLDLGMCGEADARWRLAEAAQYNDLILVEGVMGLYDGTPSAADLAIRFGLPVLALIDASAMAQTFGAIAHGLATYRPGLPFAGVLANRVGSAGHAKLLQETLPNNMRWFGAIPRETSAALPERHLGLLQAAEIPDLVQRLDILADHLAATGASELPAAVAFQAANKPELPPLLAGKRIAIARDAAYGFIYPANLDTLRELGAELTFFSPIAGDGLPDCDALWLPGGYPELHTQALFRNSALRETLQSHVAASKPLFAECGGMMSLFETLIDKEGQEHSMFGLLPGKTVMQKRLTALGMQSVTLPGQSAPLSPLNGHTFHYSRAETPLTAWAHACKQDGSQGEALYRQGSIIASYVHAYFASNPIAAASLFKS